MAIFHSDALEQQFSPFSWATFATVFTTGLPPLAAVPLLPANANPQQKILSQAAIAQAALQEQGT